MYVYTGQETNPRGGGETGSAAEEEAYLLQLSAARAHKHHRVLAVGVGRHGAHALGPVLVERAPLDDPQPPQRLVQDQPAEIIPDLLRLGGLLSHILIRIKSHL